MNIRDVVEGKAGLEGVQWALLSPTVRRLLRRDLTAMLPSEQMLGSCRLTRAKYKPGRHLTAYFDVNLLDSAGRRASVRPIEVVWTAEGAADTGGERAEAGAMEAEAHRERLRDPFLRLSRDAADRGMRIRVSPLDTDFPQLVRVSSPRHVGEMLSQARAATEGKQQRERKQEYDVSTVRYRPGQRHVLRYKPASKSEQSEGETVFAKLYQRGKGARAVDIAAGVAGWLMEQNAGIEAARPLGYVAEDQVVLYPQVRGVPLSRLMRKRPGDLPAYLSRVGSALRTLHAAPAELVGQLEPHTFDDEVKAIARASEHVQVLLPDVGSRINALLAQARELHALLPNEAPRFAHGDLKCDHLLASQQSLTLIDFDTCYLADPAIDLGKFLADLQWWYATHALSGVERAQQVFVNGYAQEVPPGRLLRARLYEALVLAKITVRRVRLFDRDWSSRTTHLVEKAHAVLGALSRAVEIG
jgi:aminoglycoside phosphotransferase (APT) family kinase protein